LPVLARLLFARQNFSRCFAAIALAFAILAYLQPLVYGQQTGTRGQVPRTEQPAVETDPTVDVSNAVSVRLRFSDFPSFNGEYRIAADQTIAIPAIGRISVRGLNLRGVEEAVAQKASIASGRQTFVTAEVLEFRPVFVTGAVGRPGPIPWQPKMTVLQAIASAGGTARSTGGGSPVTQIKRAIDDQKRWLATRARVRAELEDRDDIEIPKRLIELAGEAEAKKAVEAQKTLLLRHRASLQTQLNLIAENKRLTLAELEALKQQRAKLDEQLQLRRDRSERIDQLFSKGLAVADATLQQKLEITNLEERSASVSVAIIRAQSMVAAGDRDAANLVAARKNSLQTELETLDRSIAQGEFDLPITNRPATDRPAATGTSAYVYTVARANDDDQPDIAASPSMEIFPGDVVTVSQNVR
jgi:protein involved in polysaccharide export with SLBB domain